MQSPPSGESASSSNDALPQWPDLSEYDLHAKICERDFINSMLLFRYLYLNYEKFREWAHIPQAPTSSMRNKTDVVKILMTLPGVIHGDQPRHRVHAAKYLWKNVLTERQKSWMRINCAELKSQFHKDWVEMQCAKLSTQPQKNRMREKCEELRTRLLAEPRAIRPPAAGGRSPADATPPALECPVCLVRPKNCLLSPCRHVVCTECAPKVDKCPICRALFVSTTHFYP